MSEDPYELTENPTIESITTVIGADLMTKLSYDLGGRRLYIPNTPGPHSPLSVSVGLDAAQKISQVYGGMVFDVPIALGKKALALKMRKEGATITNIAMKTGRTERRIYQILAEDPDDSQIDLFTDIKGNS